MKSYKLKKRYYYLISGEFASLILFFSIFFYHFLKSDHWTTWIIRCFSISILSFILLQAILWWFLKLFQLTKKGYTPVDTILPLFGFIKHLNWGLISLYPIVLSIRLFVYYESDFFYDVFFGTIVFLGAVLEQINYYHIQLMYDAKVDRKFLRRFGKLRRGNIAISLRNRN